ncbi:MAG: Lrp/AsnC family transcriptional regulator [Candidatus Thorarchaeota archaeon]
MVNEALILDDIDKSIVQFIQNDPTITHTQIAKKINRSQPTVGMRIKKLEKLGILTFQAGLNLKNTNCYLAKLSLQSSDPPAIIQIIKSCPYMIQGYITSGISNFDIIIANPNLKNIDKIVNYHFRNNPKVEKINMEIITNIINKFVIPVDFRIQSCNCVKKPKKNEINVS